MNNLVRTESIIIDDDQEGEMLQERKYQTHVFGSDFNVKSSLQSPSNTKKMAKSLYQQKFESQLKKNIKIEDKGVNYGSKVKQKNSRISKSNQHIHRLMKIDCSSGPANILPNMSTLTNSQILNQSKNVQEDRHEQKKQDIDDDQMKSKQKERMKQRAFTVVLVVILLGLLMDNALRQPLLLPSEVKF